jgi:hypothetical protein
MKGWNAKARIGGNVFDFGGRKKLSRRNIFGMLIRISLRKLSKNKEEEGREEEELFECV